MIQVLNSNYKNKAFVAIILFDDRKCMKIQELLEKTLKVERI